MVSDTLSWSPEKGSFPLTLLPGNEQDYFRDDFDVLGDDRLEPEDASLRSLKLSNSTSRLCFRSAVKNFTAANERLISPQTHQDP